MPATAAPRAGGRRLLIANKYFFRKGGVETYLFDIARELPAYGYEPVWFAMRHPRNTATPYARYFVDEVDYHRQGSLLGMARNAARLLYSSQARRNIEQLIVDTRPELAHLHNIYHQLSPAILPVLRRHRIPVVMTLHDLKLACPNYKMRTENRICERCLGGAYYHAVVHRCVHESRARSALCALEAYLHRWSKVYLRNVAMFITPSEFYRRKLMESGIPAEQLTTLPNFVHLDDYVPEYAKSDYMLYFGRLSQEKGLDTLVSAVRGLPRARLLIVGEGPLAAPLQARLEAEHIDNVELTGAKSGAELVDLIRRARFSIVPSEWYENCPYAALEAMACATPVIGARIGGIPDIIDDGVTGLLFEPFAVDSLRARIETLLDDEQLCAELGRNARAKVEREYAAATHMRRLLALYAKVSATALPA